MSAIYSLGVNYLSDYENIFKSSGGRIVSRIEQDRVFEFLDYPSKKKILDVGTGTGRMARKLVGFDNNVVGIDTSSIRLKLAKEKSRKELGEKIILYDLVLADGQYLPFKEEIFDSLLCLRVIKYFKDHQLALKEFTRTLKNRGNCCIEFSNIFGYEGIFLFFYKIIFKKYASNMSNKYQLFNIYDVKNSLIDSGLSILKTVGWHRIPTFFFIKCKNSLILNFLFYFEKIFAEKIPIFILSRGIFVKCKLVSRYNE